MVLMDTGRADWALAVIAGGCIDDVAYLMEHGYHSKSCKNRFISPEPGRVAKLLSTMLWAGSLTDDNGSPPPAVKRSRWRRGRDWARDFWGAYQPRLHFGPCDSQDEGEDPWD